MSSSGSSLVACPHCEEWVAPAAVCENCGKDLQGALPVATEPVDEAAPTRVLHRADTQPESHTGKGISNTVVGRESVREPVSASRGSPLNHCPDFELEYNSARIFLSNQISSFAFRLKPLSTRVGQLRDIVLRVTCHHEAGTAQKMERQIYGVYGESPTPVSINFSPATPGVDIDSEVSLSYFVEGEKQQYVGSFLWDCLDSQASSRGVIENLIVDFKGMSANTAADQNIRVLENFNPSGGLNPVDALRQLKLEPVWNPVPLFSRNGSSAVTVTESSDVVMPVTLTASSGKVVHFLSVPDTVIGRGKGPSMIRVLAGENEQKPYVAAVMGVSRQHATIRFREGRFYIADGAVKGAEMQHSKNGCYLEGTRIGRGNWTSLPLSQRQSLILAAPQAGEFEGIPYEVQVRPDVENPERAGMLLLTSPYRPDEVFALVHGCAEISDLLGSATRVRFDLKKGQSRLVADGGSLRFRPGSSFRVEEVAWSCLPYVSDNT